VPQTRQKLKEAYDVHFAATIERAEKQIILAKYGRRLLNCLDDTPVVPGDVREPFAHTAEARQILTDAELELQGWQPHLEEITTNAAGLGSNLMPAEDTTTATSEAGDTDLLHSASPVNHTKTGDKEAGRSTEAMAS
jgi:Eisosome component PIL1